MKPSESYAGSEDAFYEFIFKTLDSLHDRIETLEQHLSCTHPDMPKQYPNQYPLCSKCGELIYGDMTISKDGDKFHVECPKQEPKCKPMVCPHDYGHAWGMLDKRHHKQLMPTCPYCPKQENKKLAEIFHKTEIELGEYHHRTHQAYLDHMAKVAIEAVEKTHKDWLYEPNNLHFIEYLKEKLL